MVSSFHTFFFANLAIPWSKAKKWAPTKCWRYLSKLSENVDGTKGTKVNGR